MQAVLTVETLPSGAIEAAATFYSQHLPQVEALIAQGSTAVAIILPQAGADHDHWRRALARDLGRKHAPIRVNVVGRGNAQASDALLGYLGGAPGVTGQYCPAHG